MIQPSPENGQNIPHDVDPTDIEQLLGMFGMGEKGFGEEDEVNNAHDETLLTAIQTGDAIGFHNELLDRLRESRSELDKVRRVRGEEYVSTDPNFNYKLGKVVGFELALNGLGIFIKAQAADQAGDIDKALQAIIEEDTPLQ
jgi:hypothetical protein